MFKICYMRCFGYLVSFLPWPFSWNEGNRFTDSFFHCIGLSWKLQTVSTFECFRCIGNIGGSVAKVLDRTTNTSMGFQNVPQRMDARKLWKCNKSAPNYVFIVGIFPLLCLLIVFSNIRKIYIHFDHHCLFFCPRLQYKTVQFATFC